MAMFVEKLGKTVDEAVEAALEELNTDIENVTVEVIDEGSKGVLGIFKNKEAKVRVTLKDDIKVEVGTFIGNILDKMDVDATVSVTEKEDCINVDISGENVGILIGRRGETLDAIQYITSLVVNKDNDDFKRIIVDVENYRQKREETLIALAYRMANKVEKYKKSITLEPMTPYERRIIHSALQERFTIETISIGEEPNRKVVIRIKK